LRSGAWLRGVGRRGACVHHRAAAAPVLARVSGANPPGFRAGVAGCDPVRAHVAAGRRLDMGAAACRAGRRGDAFRTVPPPAGQARRAQHRQSPRASDSGPYAGGRMTTPILAIERLYKSFGATDIIRGVDLQVRDGERHALIGPNGAGKSTLFHLVSGQLAPSSGAIRFEGRDIGGLPPQAINRRGLARSFQITNLFPRLSTFENVRLAVMRAHGLQYAFWKSIDRDARIREDTEKLLEQVRLAPRARTLAGEMAYSEQRSLEIAMTLASNPRLILQA